MKKLIYIILLLPLFAQAQVNGTIQRTAATGIVRYFNSGAAGIDTLVNAGLGTNGYVPVYNSTLKKSVWTNPSTFGVQYWSRSGTTLSPATANDSLNIGTGIYKGHGAKSDASDGFLIEASNGTDVGRFGVANTANISLFGALTLSGIANFQSQVNLTGTNSELNFNRSSNANSASQYFITNSIAKWRVGLTPTTDDNYHIYNSTTAGDALSINNSTNVMTLSSLSAGGLVKSTSGALGIATAGTDYLTPTGSGSGLSGVVLTSTNQSIAGVKTFTDNAFIDDIYIGAKLTPNADNVIIGSGSSGASMSSGASSNTSLGHGAALGLTTGSGNTLIGRFSGYQITTGTGNTIVGLSSGAGLTTGNNNTIIGGNLSGISSALSNNIIIADGSNNIKAQHDATNWTLTGGVSATGSISSTPQGTLYGTATGSITSAQLATSLTDETGTGSVVFSASPTFTGSPVVPGYLPLSGGTLTGNLISSDITTNANNKGLYFNGTRNAILGNNSTDEVTIVTANGVGSFLHGATGDFTISGANATKASGTAWINPSDLRLKMNVGEYSKGLAEVLKIHPKTWYFNKASGLDTTKKHLSPIAQELKLIMPEMVSTYKGKLNGEVQELLQVDASDMTWLLVKAIQEQQAIIEKLNARITDLENK
jgi:hypothetical protein